jgi:hypothetical protein
LEKSSNVRCQILESFKPLLLVLGQIDGEYALLHELFLLRWISANTMDFTLPHEAIRAVDEAGLDSDFGEFFYEELIIEACPTVFLEIVEEK